MLILDNSEALICSIIHSFAENKTSRTENERIGAENEPLVIDDFNNLGTLGLLLCPCTPIFVALK